MKEYGSYTYLLLNVFALIFPLLYSFESRISYYKKWKYLFIAILITGGCFIFWDHYFTKWKVWWFNPDYILGYYILELPVEEWLFFLIIPFSCVFIYEALNYYVSTDYFRAYTSLFTVVLISVLYIAGFVNLSNLYTASAFITTASFLVIHLLIFRTKILGRFYLAYIVHLIPFFVVNGVLTSYPVVLYNDNENMGIRLGTIPLEDMVYSMLLLLMNISIYEYLKGKKALANITDAKIVTKYAESPYNR